MRESILKKKCHVWKNSYLEELKSWRDLHCGRIDICKKAYLKKLMIEKLAFWRGLYLERLIFGGNHIVEEKLLFEGTHTLKYLYIYLKKVHT